MHRTTIGRVVGLLLATPVLLAGATAAQADVDVPSGPCTDPDGVTVVVDATELGGQVEVGCALAPATGTEALQVAGFTDTRDEAGLICAIDSLPDPCPATFEGSYWSYWYAEPGGEWQMWMEGSDTAVPVAGSVEGWRYDDGSQGPAIAPPAAGAVETGDAPSEPASAELTTAGPVAEQGEGLGAWPWLLGGGGLVVLAGAGWWLLRRQARG